MTHSMTAFARTELAATGGTLSWEIRSVNHRYLEPHLRLPDIFRELEFPVREALRKALSRGKVECTLRFAENDAARSLQINQLLAAEVIAAARSLAAMIPEPAPLNPLEILAWPGVQVTAAADQQQLNQQALELFRQALAQLKTGRTREGEELARIIRDKLDAVLEQVASLRALLPEMLASQRQKIAERCAELQISLDPERLEQEIALLAHKSDVAEELDRLTTHVAEVSRVLQEPGATGRQLDFLMQELNREANTLGSKAFDTRSTQAAVHLKVLIEQMREQVQNIE